ncbi:MAG: hypothetical protein GY811_04180 [Myxococcales bacterium]|nr:hypothetical protein [Myxococcales bacterium]
MKLAKILLALTLPLALSAGCAMDIGSNTDGLTIDTNSDFGIDKCGQTTQRWIDDDNWPIETVVIGELEFTQGELLEYIVTNPGDRTALIAEIAAAQLNMTVALELPDGVIEELIAAEGWLMAPDDENGTPPPVNLDDFGNIADFNNHASRVCFIGGGETNQGVEQTVDTRDDIVQPTPGMVDLRSNISVDE